MRHHFLAFLVALTCSHALVAHAQNRGNQQQAYRPPPPSAPAPRYSPPTPSYRPQQPSYASPSNENRRPNSYPSAITSPALRSMPGNTGTTRSYGNAFGNSQGSTAGRLRDPANDNSGKMTRSPTPSLRSRFSSANDMGNRGAASAAPTRRDAPGLRDRFKQATEGAGAGQTPSPSLRSRFSGGSDKPNVRSSNNGHSPDFGTQVKPLVGSGTAVSDKSSGLRDKFAKAGGGGGPPKPPSSGYLTGHFNKAAGNGSGRLGGSQSTDSAPKPHPDDGFGQAALSAEKKVAYQGALKDGERKHLDSMKPRSVPKPKPPQP